MEKNKWMANKIAPLHPTHPGEIIKDEITFRGISQRQLAIEIGISYTQLNELLNGKRPINTQTALLIAKALDIDAEPLLRLQTRYDIVMSQRNHLFMARMAKIRKIATIL